MCGIAGVVRLGSAAGGPEPELAVKPMVAALAARGPDAQGIWADPSAALGHNRLAIVDLDGGRQPMVRADDHEEPLAVLVFTGEVYNHHQLRGELAARGHQFRTRSDSEVVLAALAEWGQDAVGRLEGMFAFAVWEPGGRRLTLVRDRLGIKPLYYQYSAGQLRFASEPKALLAAEDADCAVDLDGFRELMLSSHPMISTPGRTAFAGIAELPPGHVLVSTPDGSRLQRYWSLRPREHDDDRPATVAAVRSLVSRAVHSHLETEVPRCTLLSGGLDSSLIASLVQQGPFPGQDTVSVDVGAGRAAAADGMARSPDAPFVELMAAHLGSRHRNVAIPAAALASPWLREQVVSARDGLGLGDFDGSLLMLFRAVREQHTVALSGEAADEVFGGYRWFQAGHDEADFPWRRVIDQGDLTRLLDPGLAAALDLPAHRRALYAQAVAELDHPDSAGEQERRLRVNSYLNLTRFLPVLLERTDRLSMSVGLEVRVPFCDHRLVEYVFNAPWSMKTFDGREKSLLRAAAHGIVPEPVLARHKSPYPVTRDPAYRTALAGQVRELLRARESPALELLSASAVSELLLAPGGSAGSGGRASRFPREGLEFVLDLDAWLRLYRPRLTF